MVIVSLNRGKNKRGNLNRVSVNPLTKKTFSYFYITYDTVEGFVTRTCGHKILLTKGNNTYNLWSKMIKQFANTSCKRCRKED